MTSHDSTAPIRILLVEDVDFNQEILADLLALRGWRAVMAKSGEEALERLAGDLNFQLILMDIGLPGMDGFETASKIRKNPNCAEIPILALTADPAPLRGQALAAGLAGCLEKNFDQEALHAAIERRLPPAPPERGSRQPGRPAESPPRILDCDFLASIYGNDGAIRRIARAFFADTIPLLARLAEAMARNDRQESLACCHSLKGAAVIFTAGALVRRVEELDRHLREETIEAALASHREVEKAHAALVTLVEQRFSEAALPQP